MTRLRGVVALLLSAAGCNSLLGVHDLQPPAGGAAGDVTGLWKVLYLGELDPDGIAEDLAAYELSAEVPDAVVPSGFRSIAAVVVGPGTFTIPGVPEGPYYLRVRAIAGDRPLQYYWTDARQIDLGYSTPGRRVQRAIGGAAPIALDLSSATPEWSSDLTGIYAPGAGSQLVFAAAGATPRLGVHGTYDWSQAQDFTADADPAPNALIGDEVTILHYRFDATGQTPVITDTGAAAVTLSSSGPTMIAAESFGAPPRTSVATQGQLSNFALRLDGGLDIPSLEVIAYFDPSAGTALHGGAPLDGAFPVLDGPPVFDRRFAADPGGFGTDLAAQIPYVDPFSGRLSVVDRYVSVRHRLLLPHASSTIDVREGKTDRRAFASPLVLAPLVDPPAGIQLDGSDPVAGVRDVPHGPLQLRWTPAAHASFYDVAIEHAFVDGTTPRIAAIARLRTADPAVAIPPELITAGERYLFRVTAIGAGAAYHGGALRRLALPHGTAEVVTGVILFSATCGNGRVDPGEDCDTAGASASCDVDCTVPVCGDGLVNPFAGERCDAADPRCTPRCTVSTCGDGYLDVALGEQCDDGNQSFGDGCSPGCMLEPFHCGDGVKNPYEECDDGNQVNTDGCRNDCKLPACGDGIIDAALGEQCDDGNRISGDGCSATCQTEPPPT